MSRTRSYLRGQLPPPGPLRAMAGGVLVTNAGEGAWYATWALCLTRVAGIPIGEVGLAMLVAGGAGVLAPGPAGRLGDRVGHRRVLAALLATSGIATCGFLVVHGVWSLLPVATVGTAADRAGAGLKTAYVAHLVPQAQRSVELARQRTASHVGYTVGAAAGGLALAVGSRAAFDVVIVANSLTSLVYCWVVRRLPDGPVGATERDDRPRRGRVAGRFRAVAVTGGALSLCWGMVSTGLPLWLADHTGLPTSLAGVVIVVNSLGVAGLQVPVGRRTDGPRAARVAVVGSGLCLAVACCLLAATSGARGAWGVAVVLLAALVHLAGELLYPAGMWPITLAATPAGRHGAYQGTVAASQGLVQMLSPGLVGVLVATYGARGWLALGALLAVAGTATAVLAGPIRQRSLRPDPARTRCRFG